MSKKSTEHQSISTEERLKKVFLRVATIDDIPAVGALLNRCYRSQEGWTNEAHLIGGIRTTQTELEKVLKDRSQYLFIYPKTDNGQRDGAEVGELIACILVQGTSEAKQDKSVAKAYIGMFAVHPDYQGQGIGDVVLGAAESFAARHYSKDGVPCQLTMSILNHRPELLAYYQRRGYQLTGESLPFPNDGNNGEPLRDDLALLELAKAGSIPH